MKKILLLASIMVMFSCVSLKDPNSANMGLLIIPHKVQYLVVGDTFGNYTFLLENLDTGREQKVHLTMSQEAVKCYLEPGRYNVKSIGFDYRQIEVSSGMDQEFHLEFEIDNNYITVLPILFITSIEEREGHGHTMRSYIDKLSEDGYYAAIKVLSEMENFELWNVDMYNKLDVDTSTL